MTSSDNRPILVAGGGIGGLSAALALGRRGFDVQEFERSSEAVAERGTGLTLWGNATTVLDRLGCGDEVKAAGYPIARTEIRSDKGRVLVETPVTAVSRLTGTTSITVRRTDLQRGLYNALQALSVPVHLGRRCTGYSAEHGGVTLLLEDGTEVPGRALIGADGARSAIRSQLLDDGDPIPLGCPIWRGVSDGDGGLDHGLALLIWGPRGGGIGGAHVDEKHASWTIAINSRVQRALADGKPKDVLLDFVGDLDAHLAEAVRQTPEEAMLSAHVLVRKPAANWGMGPVTLLGDAAHAMPTALGQGGCQALEDGLMLGHCLAEADTVEAGLRGYEQRRQRRVNWLRRRVERIDRFSRLENPVLCKLRNVAARLAPTGSPNSWKQIMTIDG